MFNYPDRATPIEPSELIDLIPLHLTTQEELNAWEEKNILIAQKWASKQKDVVSILFVQQLHKRMFDQTWKWAGKYRISEKNIGVNWHLISIEIKKLCDNVK